MSAAPGVLVVRFPCRIRSAGSGRVPSGGVRSETANAAPDAMEKKQIEISCPCCQERLVVDVRTQKILKHFSPAEVDETGKVVLDEGRWDSATERVQTRGGRGEDVFDSALGKEKSREKDLDDLFDKARKKIADRKDKLEAD